MAPDYLKKKVCQFFSTKKKKKCFDKESIRQNDNSTISLLDSVVESTKCRSTKCRASILHHKFNSKLD